VINCRCLIYRSWDSACLQRL